MILTRKPLMRVIPGPDPNQYGIIAKPHKQQKENIIERNKRFDESRQIIARQERELQSELLKTDFFEESNKKSKLKQIKRTVDEIMNQRNFLLSERRNKLKTLLLNEEQQFEQELGLMAETPLEKASKLREKARRIKEDREKEKQEFVNEKLDQKWRLECDELRNLQSKHLQGEMRLEHLRQMEEKVCRERHKMEEEAIFADLWHNDIVAKQQREDNEKRITAERNQQTVKILKEQMQVLEKQKEEQKRLLLENARLSQERVNIDKIEKSLAHQQKLRQQAARKNELDQSVRTKLMNEARKAQEEMALDLKLLEDALASGQNEDDERARKKEVLLEEGKRYREYLKVQLEEEKRREKELERIVDAEVEKQFQKRLNQWKAEKEARKRLLEDVLRERRIQVEDKIRRNEENQRLLEIEKIEVNERIEFYTKLENEERQKLEHKNKSHQNDLVGQIDYNAHLKDRKKWQEYAEYQSCIKSEDEYQKKLISNIENMKLDNLHPIRYYQKPNYEPNSGLCPKCKRTFFGSNCACP